MTKSDSLHNLPENARRSSDSNINVPLNTNANANINTNANTNGNPLVETNSLSSLSHRATIDSEVCEIPEEAEDEDHHQQQIFPDIHASITKTAAHIDATTNHGATSSPAKASPKVVLRDLNSLPDQAFSRKSKSRMIYL